MNDKATSSSDDVEDMPLFRVVIGTKGFNITASGFDQAVSHAREAWQEERRV